MRTFIAIKIIPEKKLLDIVSILKKSFWRKEKLQSANSQNRYKYYSMPARFSKIRTQKKRSKMTSCPVWLP